MDLQSKKMIITHEFTGSIAKEVAILVKRNTNINMHETNITRISISTGHIRLE